MRGVVFTGGRELELMNFPDPTPGPDEVVIEMKASGMCGSDLHQYRRPKAGGETGGLAAPSAPTIGGHEPCGIVAAVGSAVSPAQAKVGQRVMIHHYKGCTVCGHCRSGWAQLCQEVPVTVYGNNGHGGHAAYMKAPAFTVVPLPNELSFTTGAAIACGTGTAYGALRRIRLSGNDTIAIFGQGPVGLSATQLRGGDGGARVIALDVSEERLAPRQGVRRRRDGQPALQRSGRRDQGADARLRRRIHPRHFVAAGRPHRRRVRVTKVWGTACFVGERNKVETTTSSPDMLRKQLTIVASWTFSSIGQEECARFVADRKVDVEGLFTHRWKLDQADEAYKLFDTQTTGKGVFLM